MSNVHRIMWFDREIRQSKYPNCRTLAEHFEISVRQANRDLEYFKNTLNAPIRYEASKRGYIYEDKAFILPNLMITAEEKKALGFLAYRYDNYDGTENNQRISKLFKSLSDSGGVNSQTPVFSINDDNVTLFDTINLCIHNKKKLEVSYIEPDGGHMRLLLHPYLIYGRADNDYLIAYCEEYNETAIFRLDRLEKCSGTRQGFIMKEGILADGYINTLKKKPFKAKIKMVRQNYRSICLGEKVTWLEDDICEIEFYDARQFIRELMLSDCWSGVISPGWLRDKLKSRCMEIINKTDNQELV